MAGGDIGSLKIRIGVDPSGIRKGLEKAQKSLRKFGRNANFIGQDMTRGLSLPIIGIGTAALSAAADFEKLEKSLTVIMGSGEAAKKELEQLRQVALAPGLGFEQAVAGSVRLQAVGMSADQARQTLAEMGNAIASTGGTAEDLDAVTMQLTQMISKNRVLQEDFQVLQDRMPLVGDAMQAAFGTRNIEDIREMGISAQDFVAGITSEMAKFDRVQGGLANSFENVRNSIKQSMAEVGKAITDAVDIPAFLENLSSKISNLVKWFSQLSPGVKKAIVIFAALTATMGPVLMAIGSMASGFSAVTGVLAALASPIGIIIGLVAALAAGIIYLYTHSEAFRSVAREIWGLLTDLFSVFKSVGLVVWELAKIVFKAIANFSGLSLAFQIVSDNAGGIAAVIRGVINVFREMVRIIGEGVTAFVDGFRALSDGEFKKAAKSFAEGIKKTNPLTAFFGEGERLGKAYSDGYKREIERNPIDPNSLIGDFSDQPIKLPVVPTFDPTGGDGDQNWQSLAVDKLSGTVLDPVAMAQRVESVGVAVNDRVAGMTRTMAASFSAPVESFSDSISRIGEKMQQSLLDLGERFSTFFNGLNDLSNTYFSTRRENIDITHQKELEAIESSQMSQEGKEKAIQRLTEQTEKKRRKLARQEAIRAKLLGIFSATINTFEGVSKALASANIPLAIAIGAMGAAQVAMIAAQQLPALAEGGLAFGPTAALVGDNIGARVDPEVIAPLSKLESMLGNNQPSGIAARISGSDILFVWERAKRNRDRTRGY